MKQVLFIIWLGLLSCTGHTKSGHTDQNVEETPELHKIKRITLTAPYSCGGSYEKSAVFLSTYSKQRNAPELLYNGACGSKNIVHSSGMSLIANLGTVPISDISAQKIFNLKNTVGYENLFAEKQEIKTGHTYGVLVATEDIRALFVFQVISHTRDGLITIDVAVKSYSIQNTIGESSGFDWAIGSSYISKPCDLTSATRSGDFSGRNSFSSAQNSQKLLCRVQIWVYLSILGRGDLSESSGTASIRDCLLFAKRVLMDRISVYRQNGMSNKLEAEYKVFRSENSIPLQSGILTENSYISEPSDFNPAINNDR